jgi:hypothetical protein
LRLSHPIAVVALTGCLAFAQESTKVPPHPTPNATGSVQVGSAAPKQVAQRSKFVLNVLNSAVALPQNDPQDRLRVLVSAARLANTVAPKMKKSLAREGMDVEARLIASGQQPQVSMVESGLVDCTAISGLIDAVRPEAMLAADRTITSAVTACPRQALTPIEQKLSDALQHGGAPPRALMAAMQAAGAKSNWTLQQFDAVFSNLPDAKESNSADQAPILALIYEQFAASVDAATARSAGAKLLTWLGKMEASPERVQAATTTATAMKKVLGEQRFQEVLESDPVANQAAQLAGQPMEMSAPEEDEHVAVGGLDVKGDHSAELQDYPAPRRAREAAAYGFAAGNGGDKELAQRYFEIAYGAINEVWTDRLPGLNVAALIEEVSQAAASVDPVSALKQAESLEQTSARAIGMLAVAQTVLTRQSPSERPDIAQER